MKPATTDAPLLLGHFGGYNAGDEALLDGTVHLLSAAGVTNVRVVTRRADYQPVIGADCAVDVLPASATAILRATANASMVILCGGTHFYDDIPRARRMRHYRYLGRYLLVLGLARLQRRPVVALGQGIGPLVHPTGKALTRMLFRLVPAGTARDDASLIRARALGARPGWSRTADTAFARPTAAPAGPRRPTLAISPLYGAHAAGTGIGELAPLWDALVGGVADAWPSLGLDSIDVIAVRAGARESDTALAGDLTRRCDDIAPSRMLEFSGDVDALAGDLGSAAVAACGRYHAFLLALLAGSVPVILPTHQKLIDTAELLELPEALIVREATTGAIAKALIVATEFDPTDLGSRVSALRASLARDVDLVARAEPRAELHV